MKNLTKNIILLPFLLLTINLVAQSTKTANEKIIADTLKLANKISAQKAQFTGNITSLKEMSDKLQVLKTEKERKMLKSQGTTAQVQAISAGSTTKREAKRLKRKSKKAQREARRLKRSIKKVGREESRIEKLQKDQLKLQKSIDKNQNKMVKLRKGLK